MRILPIGVNVEETKICAAILAAAYAQALPKDHAEPEDIVRSYEVILHALRNSEAHLVPEKQYQAFGRPDLTKRAEVTKSKSKKRVGRRKSTE